MCYDDDSPNCYSRAICYKLTWEDEPTAEVLWQFEWPYSEFNSTRTVTGQDIFNINGGSLRKFETEGGTKWIAAFTSLYEDPPYNHSSWVFELEVESAGMSTKVQVTSITHLPHDHLWGNVSGMSGSYRASPVSSIRGEHDSGGDSGSGAP